jgi:ketopantoate reductase
MRALMVGAGAVGVVLTRALERTKGNDVTYLVRKGRRAGLVRTRLVDARSGELTVRERPAVVEEGQPLPAVDTVILAVRGDQLDAAIAVAEGLPPSVRVATVTPGFDDLTTLRARLPGRATARIAPVFASWAEGDAWKLWQPPLAKTTVAWGEGGTDADRAFAEELAAAFTAGGLPSKADAQGTPASAIAAGTPLLAAYELAGWDFDALARDRELRDLAARASKEALRAYAAGLLGRAIAAAAPVGLAMRATTAIPSEMKAMWRAHGPKIAGQTREMLDAVIARAERDNSPHASLDDLRRRLG